ncbi:MAG: TPM domain-containing protein [Bdellovibrionales bacterium]|nr:TPM domain-containing protein [Bdellovibrionales bacterium]
MAVGKKHIVEAIRSAENSTSGEIRVHISRSKKETIAMDAAKAHFFDLKMQETRERNAILLYINSKLKTYAVFGDEGIHQKVGQEFWEQLTREIRSAIQNKDITAGIVFAVREIGQALKAHFPARRDDKNELGDEITES